MNKEDASLIAQAYIDKMQLQYPIELEINFAITEDHPIGFVFFYNSKKFWKTRDKTETLVGNGPLLVLRENGELVVLPAYQSVKRSLAAYPPGKQ